MIDGNFGNVFVGVLFLKVGGNSWIQGHVTEFICDGCLAYC